MDYKKTIAVGAALTAASYMSYRAISEDMLNKVFYHKEFQDEIEQKYLDWISSSNAFQVKVKSFDGLKLNAYNIHNHDDDRYMIMVHGIGRNKSSLYSRAYEFAKLGYNILLIDQRAAGDSQGEYYTYGVKEAQDLQLWISYLTKKYPQTKICLYGLSMGAATIMMATAYELPENVKCLVEESGYSSMEEEFAYLIKRDYKLSFTYPVVKLLESKMEKKFGMSYGDVSPKLCLEENEVPILFIHGDEDKTVPFEMATILYNHNKGVKKYYPIHGAGHTECNSDENYYRNVDEFIRTYLG
ncbi:MAG: alpha/beta hydrolase [Erysipelotrichaceae bacterium]|nr:alpha/beta hydrolase [Erysipelotrichaceae bacterium]